MDLYEKKVIELQAILDKYPKFDSCVVCGKVLEYNPTDKVKRRRICATNICGGVWGLIKPSYREWFIAYTNFRSERIGTIKWLNRFGNKIKHELITDDRFRYSIYGNWTIRTGNRFLKKPDDRLIKEKFDEFLLKKKLINKIESVDRNLKSKGIYYCHPCKYKLTKINYERQRPISDPQ